MKVKVKYLNWDKGVKPELMMCFVTGDVANANDYRDVHEYEEDHYSYDDVRSEEDILSFVFEEHNRIDDEHYCRLPRIERSMCVGDLIYLDDKCYVVKPVGFEKVSI